MGQAITTSHLDESAAKQMSSNSGTVPVPALRGCSVILFTNNPTLTKGIQRSDLTEPVFPGYAGSASITFNSPVREEDGSYTSRAPSVQFQASGDATATVTIRGAAVVAGDDSVKLCLAGLFDESKTIALADDGFTVDFTINQGGDGSLNTINAD